MPPLLLVAICGALLLPNAAYAANLKLSGTLKHGAGFHVVVIKPNGLSVDAEVAKNGRFKLTVPARGARDAVVQLLRANGHFYGPLVFMRSKTKAYEALSGKRNLKLGIVTLKGNFAAPRKAVARAALDLRHVTKASRGRPVGAGKLGFVKLRKQSRASAAAVDPATTGISGADTDGDGIPDAIDVDDNGDGILDVGQSGDQHPLDLAHVWSNLKVSLEGSVNVNAGNADAANINTMLQGYDWVTFAKQFGSSAALSEFNTITSMDVNCFAISFCSATNGTGDLFKGDCFAGGPTATCTKFDTYDPDQDSLPDLDKSTMPNGSGIWSNGILTRATLADKDPASTIELVQHTATGTTSNVMTLGPFFVTTPAVTVVDDGSGNPPTAITYPVGPNDPGTSGGPSHEIQLHGTTVTLTWWRPQRLTIPGAESGSYMDMGHLYYSIDFTPGPSAPMPQPCSPSVYTNLSPTLSKTNDNYAPLLDSADDSAPDAANKLSATLDLSACYGAGGYHDEATIGVTANDGTRGDNAAQRIWVRFP